MPVDGPPSSQLKSMLGSALAVNDWLKGVDESDHNFAGTGTDFHILISELIIGLDRLTPTFWPVEMFSPAQSLDGQAGQNKRHIHIPDYVAGKKLDHVIGYVDSPSNVGPVQVSMRKLTGNPPTAVSMLSSVLTIGQGAISSVESGGATVNASNATVAEHDVISFDLDVGGTGSGVLGLYVHTFWKL